MNNTSSNENQFIYGPAIPLFNSGPWNPDLHPRGDDGRFVNAIQRAMNLPIDLNSRRNGATKTNPFISHYGWHLDPNQDPHSNPSPNSGRVPTGNHDNPLNANSLAISDNVAQVNHLKVGDKVYINGQYIGNYDDTAPEDNTIDVYDPHNAPNNKNWGGTVRGGARVTGRR